MNDEVFNYYGITSNSELPNVCSWQRVPGTYYSPEKSVMGLTKTLISPGPSYDATTHKYLGEYLRFVRDYYNVNLMSMYNCFSDEICSNVNCLVELNNEPKRELKVSSLDSTYKLYKIPVKLFADYTIAIESSGGIELFCGLYNSVLDITDEGKNLIKKTYYKVTEPLFNQPFLYNKLNVKFWKNTTEALESLCWNIAAREQDLYLFIKVPAACKSSIVVLEGDYRECNSSWYEPSKKTITVTTNTGSKEITKTIWEYAQNKALLNFSDSLDLNSYEFKPISRLQLLAFNTGESYPFADRLIEYLAGSAITPIDDISDNIARTQRVMSQNKNFFKIEGLWEEKMQNILYDYMTNSGEIRIDEATQKLKDTRNGYHRQLGHTSKSTLYDILGYVDRDTEKTYASYTKKADNQGKLTAQVKNTIQNVDIYNGLYDN
jgi:hypothetical protein